MNIARLIEFVREKHDGQVRKYTGEPYFMHCLNVACMADDNCHNGFEVGLCHDLIEDTSCTRIELYNFLRSIGYGFKIADEIVKSVEELTDVYTSERYPDMNRGVRKIKEAERLWTISPDSQTVKYCDLIDNTGSIVKYDPRFAEKYLPEKEYILSGCVTGNPEIYAKAIAVLNQSKILLADGKQQN